VTILSRAGKKARHAGILNEVAGYKPLADSESNSGSLIRARRRGEATPSEKE